MQSTYLVNFHLKYIPFFYWKILYNFNTHAHIQKIYIKYLLVIKEESLPDIEDQLLSRLCQQVKSFDEGQKQESKRNNPIWEKNSQLKQNFLKRQLHAYFFLQFYKKWNTTKRFLSTDKKHIEHKINFDYHKKHIPDWIIIGQFWETYCPTYYLTKRIFESLWCTHLLWHYGYHSNNKTCLYIYKCSY